MIALQLLSRPGCQLCDEMLEELAPLISGRATVEIIDISDDDALAARYSFLIPVLMHGDQELCRYRLDRDRVASLLGLPPG